MKILHATDIFRKRKYMSKLKSKTEILKKIYCVVGGDLNITTEVKKFEEQMLLYYEMVHQYSRKHLLTHATRILPTT